MCARFNLATPESVGKYFQGKLKFDEPPRYNIAPTDMVLNVVAADDQLTVEPQKWSLHLGSSKVINLRSEASHIEKALAPGASLRRCLVPASGFFEWREEGGGKQPYNFVLASGEPFAMAGLCKRGDEGHDEFAILTCEPNELVAEYHDRMPSVIASEHAVAYLCGERDEVLALTRIPFPAELIKAYPVTRKVNSAKFQDAVAIEPAEPENPSLF